MKAYRRKGDISLLILNLGSRRTKAVSLTHQTFHAEEQIPVPTKQELDGPQSWSGDEKCSCLSRNSKPRWSLYAIPLPRFLKSL